MDPPPPVAAVKGRARGRARGRPRDPNSDASGTEDSTGSRPGSVWSLASSSLADSFGSQSQLRASPQHSSRESPDFTSEVLSSVENLKTSTRKTIYEPETDSGISSGQSTVASLPQTSITTTTDIL